MINNLYEMPSKRLRKKVKLLLLLFPSIRKNMHRVSQVLDLAI